MTLNIWHRLDVFIRNLTPLLFTLFLVLVSVVPLRVPGFAAVTPALSLVAVYYWAIFRPDLLPAVAVFAIGLVQDILSGMPLGVNTLVLLAAHAVVASQRRFFLGKSFLVMWWGFLMVAAMAAVATWIIVSMLYGRLLDPAPLGFQFLLTVAIFPCLTWLFIRVQQTFLR